MHWGAAAEAREVGGSGGRHRLRAFGCRRGHRVVGDDVWGRGGRRSAAKFSSALSIPYVLPPFTVSNYPHKEGSGEVGSTLRAQVMR